jgi:hypothetical protein
MPIIAEQRKSAVSSGDRISGHHEVPIHTIKELAGHSSIETTLRYMHTGEKAKLEAIAQTFGSSCHKNATSHSPKREKPSN